VDRTPHVEGGLNLVEFNFPVAGDESARLDALRSYNVLDTPPEREFDDLVRLAAQVSCCPVGSLTFVDSEREWYKARLGFEVAQTPRARSGLCSNTILQRNALIVPDALADERFMRSIPATELGVRFYVGVPLVNPESHVLGTLCVLDRVPRQIAPEQLEALHVIARQVMRHLELRRVARIGEFRERLISILSSDLRQPLQRLLLSARHGLRPVGSPSAENRYLEEIAISAERMTRVMRDAMDFARTRDGSRLSWSPRPTSLAAVCRRVVLEFGFSYPTREIQLEVSDEGVAMWDEDRIAQAVSNLVVNAFRYGAPALPVRLGCSGDDSECVISVHNEGEPIPPEVMGRLFAPFCRRVAPNEPGEGRPPPMSGIGLGLFVVRQVAVSCGGTVEVSSSSEMGTTFRLRLPRKAPPADGLRPALRH
jgi:signal transduction histidine kinase